MMGAYALWLAEAGGCIWGGFDVHTVARTASRTTAGSHGTAGGPRRTQGI
jgi:hypothetical protein